jgi:hypothetical protein
VIASVWWLWGGELLQVAGILWIAFDIYQNGRRFGARRMRAALVWSAIQASPGAAWRRLHAEWRRLRHVPTVVQLSGTGAAVSGGSARLSVSYADDTPVTIELRRRIEDIEMEQQRTRGTLAAYERRLDDVRRAHDDLAAGGVFVQARSVVLVVAGSLIATASSWLSQTAWWSVLLVVAAVALVWFLASPVAAEAPPAASTG